MQWLFGIAAAALFVVIYALSTFAASIMRHIELDGSQRTFEISRGQTVKEIVVDLESQGIIDSNFWFRTLVWLQNKEKDFVAGSFALPEQPNSIELLGILTQHMRSKTRTIQIIEGWDIRDIAAYFENRGMFQQKEITELLGLPAMPDTVDAAFFSALASRYPILDSKKEGASLEGYLFPDTYEIYADATIEEIVEKMVLNFDTKITDEIITEARAQEKDFYDVLIMASIIEAEVPHAEDRAIVSDIFWSRLESGVSLQSDATLNYVIKSGKAALTSEHLEIDSLYNSYKYAGLPPTPIGNPGIDSITAALHPAHTDYFYFLSTPEGQTVFSRTLEEHNAAKARYLR